MDVPKDAGDQGFEDKVHELFAQGVLPGFVHLYAGEEAVAVGVCAHLHDGDSITSTHRDMDIVSPKAVTWTA